MIIVLVGLAVAVILAVCTLRLVGFVLWVVCMADCWVGEWREKRRKGRVA